VTTDQLRSIVPRLPAAKRELFFPFLQSAMEEFAINTPAREAAFVAQLAHESGQLRFMEEIWGPTDAQRRYEPASTLATRLGNMEAGDGKRFKGRGPIQITGRANYRQFGDLLGLDLLGSPEQAAVPDVAFRIAALFWAKNGLNEVADRPTADAFKQITRRINGGFNGLEERQHFYATACSVLGVPPGAARGRAKAGARQAPLSRGHEAIREDAERGRRPKRRRSTRRVTRRKRAQGSGLKAQGPRRKAQGSRRKAQGSRRKAQGSRRKRPKP
jgi:putative chitinase